VLAFFRFLIPLDEILVKLLNHFRGKVLADGEGYLGIILLGLCRDHIVGRARGRASGGEGGVGGPCISILRTCPEVIAALAFFRFLIPLDEILVKLLNHFRGKVEADGEVYLGIILLGLCRDHIVGWARGRARGGKGGVGGPCISILRNDLKLLFL